MYIFRASGEIGAALSTCAQTIEKSMASTSNDGSGQSQVCHSGPVDQIGQA